MEGPEQREQITERESKVEQRERPEYTQRDHIYIESAHTHIYIRSERAEQRCRGRERAEQREGERGQREGAERERARDSRAEQRADTYIYSIYRESRTERTYISR